MIAAAAQRTVFINGNVTKLAGAAARAAVEFSIEENCRANSHPCVHVDEIVQAAAQSKILLGGRAPPHAVLKQARHRELPLHDPSERDVLPFLHLAWARERQHYAGIDIDDPGMTNANPAKGTFRFSRSGN